jgi:hypothetical protein
LSSPMIFYFFGLSRQARLMLSVGRVIDRRDPAITQSQTYLACHDEDF